LFRIKKEAKRRKKNFKKIRFKMMFKTTPDSMDAQKPAREIPFGRKCRTIRRYPHPALSEAGYVPLSDQTK
jgi:hypothetical protein